MPKTSTERVRAFRERQKAGKPLKPAPKSAAERAKQYRERQKALRDVAVTFTTITVPGIPTMDIFQSTSEPSINPLPSEPQSFSSVTPIQYTSDPNVEATNELYDIQMKNEDIIDIVVHPIKQEFLVNENIEDIFQLEQGLDIQNIYCFFCNKDYKKHKGRVQPLIVGDKESLKETLQMYKEFLKNSEIYGKIETLIQLYYHKICHIDFFNKLKANTIEVPQTKYHVTKFLHEKTFKEICTMIEENIIKKRHCYFFSHLIQEYNSLIKKFAEEDGRDCDLVFSEQYLQKKLLNQFSNIKIIVMKTKNVIMPEDQEMDDELFTLLEEKDILQKAAFILRNKILDSNVSDTIEGKLRVSRSLTDFYTILLSGSQLRRQSSNDCYRKVNSMTKNAICAVFDNQKNIAKRVTIGKASNNLMSNTEDDVSTGRKTFQRRRRTFRVMEG